MSKQALLCRILRILCNAAMTRGEMKLELCDSTAFATVAPIFRRYSLGIFTGVASQPCSLTQSAQRRGSDARRARCGTRVED